MNFFRKKKKEPQPVIMTDNSIIRRHYRFTGIVQGVGFRFRCFSIANELKLTGFVKNEYDGSVSMEVQGEGMQIERMIEKLYQQPFIEIEQIHYHLLNIKEYEKSFEIRY